MQMSDGQDDQLVFIVGVDNAGGKTPRLTAPNLGSKTLPGHWETLNALNRGVDLVAKRAAQAGKLHLVVQNGLSQLLTRKGEIADLQRSWNSSKISSCETEATSPAL